MVVVPPQAAARVPISKVSEAKVPPNGNTVRVPKGGSEWALNVGDQTYHEDLIELKKT